MKAVTETECRNESGQTMAEYAVVLGVISIATLGVFTLLAGEVTGLIQAVVDTITP
jgi:Flp pilus assembly pilin Flp